MATLAATVARQAATLTRLSSPKTATALIQRRGLAGAADHHGPPKVNFWQDPMSPSKWKEEHFVIVSLSGWGLLFFGGYKFFTRGARRKRNWWKHHSKYLSFSVVDLLDNNVLPGLDVS